MNSSAKSVIAYVEALPADRKEVINRLRDVICASLPKGFEETMGYGMIAYVIPKSLYPAGYHVNPELPLPFINLASQKNFVALYHMGLYSDKKLLAWFEQSYSQQVQTKLDMGKSCIRFKKMETIPYDLIGELVAKMGPEDWIDLYEKQLKSINKKAKHR